MQRYEPKPWDIRRCDMVCADDGQYVRYDEARAEIERLTKAHDTVCGALAEAIKRAEKAKAALEVYGREKMREGMRMAAALGNELPDVMWDMPWTEYEHGIASLQSAILAEMEKLK